MSKFGRIRKMYQDVKHSDGTLDIWLWAIAFVTVFGFIAQNRNTLTRPHDDLQAQNQYASFQTQRHIYGLQLEEAKDRPRGSSPERLETGM